MGKENKNLAVFHLLQMSLLISCHAASSAERLVARHEDVKPRRVFEFIISSAKTLSPTVYPVIL